MQSKLIEYIIAETCNYFEIPVSDFKKIYAYTPKNIILAKKLAVNLSIEITKEKGTPITQEKLATIFNSQQQDINYYYNSIKEQLKYNYELREHKKAIKQSCINLSETKSLREYWTNKLNIAQSELNKLPVNG